MAYTFDGVNKLIILSTGTTTVDAKDLYSRWKDWSLIGDNTKYLQAVSVLGGDPLPGGRYLGTTYFLENGWKIRPYEGNHTLVLSGNLYSRDGSDPFVNTLGSFNVRIMLTVSNLVDTVTTGGGVGTVAEVRDAVWSDTNFASHGPTTAGAKLNAAGNAGDPWTTDLSSYLTAGTAGYIVNNIPAAHTQLFNAIDAISGGVGINTGATSFTLTQGTVVSGTYEDTHTFNDAEHYIRDNAGQFDVQYMFDIETESAPVSFTFVGYVQDKHEVLTISAWNYRTFQWEQIATVSGANTNKSFIGTLYRDHVGFIAGEIGDVKIRMHSNVVSDIFVHIDQMYVSYTKVERNVGYSGHAVSATANTIVLGSDASSVDNYYAPSLLTVNHGTGQFQYAKVIGYTGSTKTLQLELPMATILDTTSHITLSPWASAHINPTQYYNIDSKLTNIETTIDQLSGLTPQQATMLTEMYKLMGLDPTKPLVVTKTSRTAGSEIQQTISGDTNSTTVTRV